MKKIFLFISISLFCSVINAQTANIQWLKYLGGSDVDNVESVKQTTDGGYIVIGTSNSHDGDVAVTSSRYFDYWILKLSSSGAIQWQKTLGSTNTDHAYKIQQTNDGGYILIGTVGNSDGDVIGNFGSQIWVVKLNAMGTVQWQKSLGGTYEEVGYSIIQTSDGGYAIAGTNNSNDGDVTGNHGFIDAWVIKLNSSGTLLWQKSYGGTEYDVIYSIRQTTDGGYILAGQTGSNDGNVTGFHGFYDAWILKLNPSGNLQWQKALGGTGQEIARDINLTNDGGYIIVGHTNSLDGNVVGPIHGDIDAWIIKINTSGVIQWQKSIGGNGMETVSSVQQTIDGGFIVGGTTNSNNGDIIGNHINSDGWIFKLNNSGILLWQKYIGGDGVDLINSIQQTSDAGYIIAGMSNTATIGSAVNHGNFDYLIAKLSPETLSNDSFDFEKTIVYPNPVQNILQISSTENLEKEIIIYDQNGKQIIKNLLVNNTIDLTKLASGAYLMELRNLNGKKIIKRFVKK